MHQPAKASIKRNKNAIVLKERNIHVSEVDGHTLLNTAFIYLFLSIIVPLPLTLTPVIIPCVLRPPPSHLDARDHPMCPEARSRLLQGGERLQLTSEQPGLERQSHPPRGHVHLDNATRDLLANLKSKRQDMGGMG